MIPSTEACELRAPSTVKCVTSEVEAEYQGAVTFQCQRKLVRWRHLVCGERVTERKAAVTPGALVRPTGERQGNRRIFGIQMGAN